MRSSNNYITSSFCVLADARETRRVDTYLSALFPEKSRSYIQKMIEEGKISCNGAPFTKNKKIYRGDVIEIEWKIEQMELVAEDIPLDIIFENDDFAIINKDAGMNTHPTPGEDGRKGTLVNALLYHFKTLGARSDKQQINPNSNNDENSKSGARGEGTVWTKTKAISYDEQGEEEWVWLPLDAFGTFGNKSTGNGVWKIQNKSIINGVERPGIVHRLDKDTSWLIIIAKNDRAMHALQLKIAKRTIQKTYLALVVWKVREHDGYIESFIGRDKDDRKKMTTIDPVNPKLAKTKFCNRWYIADKYTLLEVDLLTGRTHQIRVHLSSIGFPILGDKIYGRDKENREAGERYGLTRQWLHAYKLEFNLFGTDYVFEAPLKNDLNKVIEGRDE